MTKQINLLFILITTLFFSACIEEIDFEVPREYQNSTVIVGKLVNSEKPSVEVFIQKIFDFSFVEEKYLRAKNIRLVDQDGNSVEIPRLGLGNYRLDLNAHPEFEVAEGRSYSLQVDLLDGQKFESKLETILTVPKIEKVEPELVQKKLINYKNEEVIKPRVFYTISTPLAASQDQGNTNLRWVVERTHKQTDNSGKSCYITSSPDFDLIEFMDAKTLSLTSLKDHKILEQSITNFMTEGQYISVIQESINDETLRYFQQMKELSINNGTFYEPPAGKIITNFENVGDVEGSVFGYFYATSHDTVRTFIDSEFVDHRIAICPYEGGSIGGCDDCCDCENAENSTTIKPSYWKN